jgi:hypothetical protein
MAVYCETKGPPRFATAAINGDRSGMDERDERAFEAWLAFNVPDGWDITDVADDSHYSWSCDAYGLPWAGGELVTYTIMLVQEPKP